MGIISTIKAFWWPKPPIDETQWHRVEAPDNLDVDGAGKISRGTMVTRRKQPSGHYEYRFTDEDRLDELDRQAW